LGLDIFILLVHPVMLATVENGIFIGSTTLFNEIWGIDVTKQMFRFSPFPPNLFMNATIHTTTQQFSSVS